MEGSCRDSSGLIWVTFAHGALMCLASITLAIIPVLLVAKLQLNRRGKIVITGLLVLGSV
jgi:hypothetical protein